MNTQLIETLGLTDAKAFYEQTWTKNGFLPIRDGYRGRTTPTIQSMFANEANRKKSEHFFIKSLQKQAAQRKDVNAALIQDNIPIKFDPEVLDILTDAAPALAVVPERGWDGFTVASNRIDTRDAPLGYRSEAFAMDLSGQTGTDFDMQKATDDLKIYVDLINVSDFSQAAGQFYINLKDTTLGTRLAEHGQLKEKALLYGKPAENTGDGSPGDANAYKGLSELYPDTNKSAVDISGTKALLKDIQREIKGLLQSGKNVQMSDLKIFTSWDVHQYLSDEMQISARINQGEKKFNFGFEDIFINNVPVIATHNVAAHSFSGYTPGDPGDVFIYNSRATQYFDLAPLSTIPLGRIGLADRAALFEFAVLHERANGQWGKYLQAYNI